MVVIMGKISRGTMMDQIYIPKQRAPGLEIGVAVLVEPVTERIATKPKLKPYYYNVKSLEPIKVSIIEKIFDYFEHAANVDNVLVAGSFLEHGFEFQDIDIVVLTEKSVNNTAIKAHFKATLGIDIHLIILPLKELLGGIASDSLFQMLLSRFIAKKRLVVLKSRLIKYKLLDLQLLESKALIDSFDFLNGREKYKLTRNAVAIACFLDNKPLNSCFIDKEIERHFGEASVISIKENTIGPEFLLKYKLFHKELFKRILEGVKNEPK
ncbi:hypothetical protein HYU12_03990 [Candidatus Woesearchaeota archaeon]|nr:hypothetical protein [Candidatus Woesearchaeota archaeon]